MQGFTYFEILFSLLLLGFVLESSKTINQQQQYSNLIKKQTKDLTRLQTNLDLLQSEQLSFNNFSENCSKLENIEITNYNFYICKLEEINIVLWKRES